MQHYVLHALGGLSSSHSACFQQLCNAVPSMKAFLLTVLVPNSSSSVSFGTTKGISLPHAQGSHTTTSAALLALHC